MKQERCRVCGEAFDPHQLRQRYCSGSCRIRAFREQKRYTGHSGPGETLHALSRQPLSPQKAGKGPVEAIEASVFEPCVRPGYPEGLFEAKDMTGLPVFFDAGGARLYRVQGPCTLPDVNLSLASPPLERTGQTFPGGMFCRAIA